MALAPLTDATVSWQSCLVEVEPASRFAGVDDRAHVRTSFALDAGGRRDVGFVLPLAEALVDRPTLTCLGAAGRVAVELAPVSLDALARRAVAPLGLPDGEPGARLWDDLRLEARGGVVAGTARLRPGEHLAVLTFTARVPHLGDGRYELRLLGPLAGASASPAARTTVVLGLPHLPGAPLTLHGCSSEERPGTPVESGREHSLAGRRFVSHRWPEPDVILRAVYAYGEHGRAA